MKMHALATAALAGLSTGAMGQSLSVNLSWDVSNYGVGDIVTATITASFTGFEPGAYLSSINIDLIAETNRPLGEVSSVGAVAWNNPGLGFDGQGTASGADIIGIEASQFSLIPPFDTGNPIMVMSFEFQTWDAGMLSYRAEVADGAPFAFSVTGPNFADQPVQFGVDAFSSGTTAWVPSPGVVGSLGVACLLAARRRRVG